MVRKRKVHHSDTPPLPVMVKERGRLVPLTPYDEEAFDNLPDGMEFELKAEKSKQSPTQRRYWMILNRVCKATGKWPRAYELHNNLKIAAGYFVDGVDMVTGKPVKIPSSTAIEAMTAREFLDYFNAVMPLLERAIGFNPEDVLNDR